jgi:hypothetical protein
VQRSSPSTAPTREELPSRIERLEVLERSASSSPRSSNSSKISATDGERERLLKQGGGLRKGLGQLTAGSPPSSPGPSDSEGWSDRNEEAGDVGHGPAGTGEPRSKEQARPGGAGAGAGRGPPPESSRVVTGAEKEEESSSGAATPRATLSSRTSATPTGRRAASSNSLASGEEVRGVVGSVGVEQTVLKQAGAESPVTPTATPTEPQPAVAADGVTEGRVATQEESLNGQTLLEQAASDSRGHRATPVKLVVESPAGQPSRPRTQPASPSGGSQSASFDDEGSPRSALSGFANQFYEDHTDCAKCVVEGPPHFNPSDGKVCADGKCAPAGVNAGCSHCDKILRARHNRNCQDFYVEDTQPVKRGRTPLHVFPHRAARIAARGYQGFCQAVASAGAFCKGFSKELSAVSKEVASAVVDDLLPPTVDKPPHGHKVKKTKAASPAEPVPRVPARACTSSTKPPSSNKRPAPDTVPRGTQLQHQPGRGRIKNTRAANEHKTSKQTVQCLARSNSGAAVLDKGAKRGALKTLKSERPVEKKNRSGWGVLDFLNLVPKDKALKRSAPKPQPQSTPQPAPSRSHQLMDIRLPNGDILPQQYVPKSMRRAIERNEKAEASSRREARESKERLRRRAAEYERAQAERREREEEARRRRMTSSDPLDRRHRWAVNSAVNDACRIDSRGRRNNPEVIEAAIRSVPPGASYSP